MSDGGGRDQIRNAAKGCGVAGFGGIRRALAFAPARVRHVDRSINEAALEAQDFA